MQRFDAIVLGAGVIGAAAAYHLAHRGARTLVLERFAFGHAHGSSHGGSRIFRNAYPDVAHVRMALAADALWTALEDETGERSLQRTGGLDFGVVGGGELEPIEAALRQAGSGGERLTAAEVRAAFPVFAVPDDVEALFQASAAIVPASCAVATLLRAAGAAGAVLRDGEPVERLDLGADGVSVATPMGRYAADRLVVATGPWLGEVLPDLALPLHVEQQQVLYVAVGDEARAAATVAAVRHLLPGLSARLVGYQTCLYTKTPDERFVLDRHPERPHVVVAGGGSGHAFEFGPLLGAIAADLALDAATARPTAGFGLGCFAGT
ncbi:MAG: FAD-dependent oxidoreductase [Trueperaceae bacterium]|nr:FAD-dependent oxidoreductase [Trueperaceae bacterium]